MSEKGGLCVLTTTGPHLEMSTNSLSSLSGHRMFGGGVILRSCRSDLALDTSGVHGRAAQKPLRQNGTTEMPKS